MTPDIIPIIIQVLVLTIISYFFNKKLESIKSNLNTIAKRDEIKFLKFNDNRINIINNFYSQLVNIISDLEELIKSPLKNIESEPADIKAKEEHLHKIFKEFKMSYSMNRLYFIENSTNELANKIINDINTILNEFKYKILKGSELQFPADKQDNRNIIKELRASLEAVKNLKSDLENEFIKIIECTDYEENNKAKAGTKVSQTFKKLFSMKNIIIITLLIISITFSFLLWKKTSVSEQSDLKDLAPIQLQKDFEDDGMLLKTKYENDMMFYNLRILKPFNYSAYKTTKIELLDKDGYLIDNIMINVGGIYPGQVDKYKSNKHIKEESYKMIDHIKVFKSLNLN